MVEKSNLVSVIIPYFNKVNTIERAVDSVINQTHSNWEIWIVDDCSDIKLEVKERWKNLPINLLYNEHNLGPGPSRQKALDLANGNYVAFLDADDWWESSFFEHSLGAHKMHNNKIAFTWAITVTHFGNGEIRERKHNRNNFKTIRETLIKYGHPWSTSSLLWNKKFCAKWKDLTTNQDSLFEFDSSLYNNKICPIKKVLCTKDETVGNNRVNIIKREIIIKNRYKLYKYILKMSFFKFNIFYKIIILNRYMWCIFKIGSITEKNILGRSRYSSLIKIQGSKVLHLFLQKTPFKIHLGH